MSHRGHHIAPDFWRVEDVGRAAFKGAYYVAGHLLRIGKVRGVRQVVGHGSMDRSGLDGDDTDSGAMKAATESLEEEGKSAFSGTVHVVGAASSISGDGGDGGQASGASAF